MKTFTQYLTASIFFVFATQQVVSAVGPAAVEAAEITRSFSVTKGGRLEVDTESGDIRIMPWDKNEVVVRVDGISQRDSDRVKITQSGNTVSVRYRGRWGWFSQNIRFEVNIPSQFNVDLETAGGDIDIRGALSGQLEGRTSGGNLRVDSVAGPVTMKTSGGDISVKTVQGNSVFKSSGGDIRVGVVTGNLEAVTAGGDIKIDGVGKNLRAKTAGGDITVGDVGGDAMLSTAGGGITVGKVSGKATLSTSGGDIELRGATGPVTAKTAGGDIRLDNVSGSVQAKTAGGEIVAELIPRRNSKSSLSSSWGDIKLYIAENARATINAQIRLYWPISKEQYEIISDFKPEKREQDGNEIRATIMLNGGGEDITLSTVNANIEIRKLGEQLH